MHLCSINGNQRWNLKQHPFFRIHSIQTSARDSTGRLRQPPSFLLLSSDISANTSYRQHKQVRTSSKKRSMASKEQVEILSDDSSSSDADIDVSMADQLNDEPQIDISSEVMLFRSAKSYQEYMKLIPIPTNRGSVIPFKSWVGLGSSIKQLYNQPLHYLTNVQLKKMDQERLGAEDEDVRLDTIIHPTKAETFIWLMEEIHRRTSSPHHLLQLWEANSKYHAFIDAIFPKLG
ncbi:hypothetical protein ACS0TY_028016 [Phlomoides rotata]